MNPRPCPVYHEHCSKHGFYHGAEAEELREGIERIIRHGGYGELIHDELRRLLDRVDARDSLAYLEAKERR